jgi:cobalamin biosynthesis protein CbiG
LFPAFATGCASLIIITSAVAEGQLPLLTVHKKALVPVPSEVTGELKLPAEVMLLPPEITDHRPVPIVGLTALSVTDAAQSV